MWSSRVSLVVPGRNVADTLGACLDAVVENLEDGLLDEIILVDDGSTDATAATAERYPVTVLTAGGIGPGGARNLGWRATAGEIVWFIDADCVAKPRALEILLEHLRDPAVGGAGGTYANEVPSSLLGSLIHAEIVERHRRMPTKVGYLATYNVCYRRSVLEALGGFDERLFNAPGKPGAEDIDFAYRACSAGWQLRFDPRSVVGHYHPTRLRSYLRTQRNHGFWRVALHLRHKRQGAGDDYSSVMDHAQPVVAVLAIAATPLVAVGTLASVPVVLWAVLLGLQLPMTLRILSGAAGLRGLAYVPLGAIRAVWRGFGMTTALLRHAVPGR